jgi:hypothetical protein
MNTTRAFWRKGADMADEKEVLHEIDNRPRSEISDYLQVCGEVVPIDPLLTAHRQVMYNLRQSGWHRPTDPFTYMEECLLVADVFAGADEGEEVTEVLLALPQPRCPTHDLRDGILALMVQLSNRGWNAEIFSDFKTPTAEDSKYHLRLSIRVTPDGPVEPKYWGYSFDTSKFNFTGHKKLVAHNLNTVEAYEGYWLLMDRFSTRLVEIEAAYQMVGDLSEGVLLCSYNEDDIRELWINGQLNERIKSMSESMPWEYDRFVRQMGFKFRPDGDYEAALTERIAAINGWPKRWSNDPNKLDPLTIQEQLKVLPLQLQEPDSRWQALNRYCDLRAELEKRLPSNATGTNP